MIECAPAHSGRGLADGEHQIRCEWTVFGERIGDRLITGDRVNRGLPDLFQRMPARGRAHS